MKSRSLLNLALLVLVAGLGVFLYLKPKPAAAPEIRLSGLKPDEIQRISVERPGRPAVNLDKQGGAWFVTAPFRARADSFQVQHLLEVLSATSPQRLPAAGLSRFDLDQPALRVTIGPQRFSFGMLNLLTHQQYVETAGSVYLISAGYGGTVPSQAADYASHRLLTSAEQPVGFTFPDFSLSQTNGDWSLTPPQPGLSQDDFNRWVDDWRYASSLATEPYSGSPSLGKIGIALKGGKRLSLEILQWQPELVLLRPDESMEYHFASGMAKQLLAPPAASPKAAN